MSRELPGDARARWLERQPTPSQRCVVCGDNEVPRRVALIFADGRECFICKDASWCQARAVANVYERLVTS